MVAAAAIVAIVAACAIVSILAFCIARVLRDNAARNENVASRERTQACFAV